LFFHFQQVPVWEDGLWELSKKEQARMLRDIPAECTLLAGIPAPLPNHRLFGSDKENTSAPEKTCIFFLTFLYAKILFYFSSFHKRRIKISGIFCLNGGRVFPIVPKEETFAKSVHCPKG